MLPSPYGSGLGPRIYAFRGHICVHCRYGPVTRNLPKGDLVDGLQDFEILGWDRDRARLAVGEGFPFPLFRLRNGFTVSPWRTFLDAPLKSWTARFPGSSSKPWLSSVDLPMAWRGLNAGSCTPLPLLVCLQPRLLEPSSACRRFYQAGRLDDRGDRQVSRAPLPNSGVTSVGETWSVSWEGVTPPSSLVLAHAPLPLSSLLLRLLASFGESLQVVTSPCCSRQLPDVISDSLFLDAGSPTPAVHRVLAPVSSTVSSAFPTGKVGRLPASIPLETTSCGGCFEDADISLCSGLQVCSPPRSSLPLRILPQGSRGFYVRAERGSLPPRASDMLTARRQAIGGAGTCTPLDYGLVGCSFPAIPLSCHPNYRALTLALAGLSPAEHTSLTWLQLPYGGFSPVRLQSWPIRQCLPNIHRG